MVLTELCDLNQIKNPLIPKELPDPVVGDEDILVKIMTCGVCHTELDEIEGRTPPPALPIVPGHQIVGRLVQAGSQAKRFKLGARVGIGWIFKACGECAFCLSGQDNLCEQFQATGRDANGGYAEYIKINEKFAFEIPDLFSDAEAAPLLCAGAIGYRSLRLTNLKNGQNLGLTGFGASAHLVLKMVNKLYPETQVFVFARNPREREFALELGAAWSGSTEDFAPVPLEAVIDTTPVWKPVVEALKNLSSGGRLVINAIRKEDHDKHLLAELDYVKHLWMEKEIKSVANVATRDIKEFLDLAAAIPIKPHYQEYAMEDANQALLELKNKKIEGAKVLNMTI